MARIAAFAALIVMLCACPAGATTEFARRTMLSCSACHSVGNQLTILGSDFKAGGYRLPKLTPRGEPVVAVRGQAVYSSDSDPTGLPKAIVDEIDYLSAAPISPVLNYNAEVYALDGGRPGGTREAWVEYYPGERDGHLPISIRAGLQVLPIPVDPERFRESNAHYAVYDQTVGANDFTFFDPHGALRVVLGSETHGLAFTALEVGSGGTMLAAQSSSPALTMQTYVYNGHRAVAPSIVDRFTRAGYAAAWYRGRFSTTLVMQHGFDENADAFGTAIASSGGFLQERVQLGRSSFALARYDGVSDTSGAFGRSLTAGAGTHLGSALRLEFEDTITRTPQTHHAISLVLGFGFGTVRDGSSAY